MAKSVLVSFSTDPTLLCLQKQRLYEARAFCAAIFYTNNVATNMRYRLAVFVDVFVDVSGFKMELYLACGCGCVKFSGKFTNIEKTVGFFTLHITSPL